MVNAIRGVKCKINDETMINKVLRTLLPIYVIRVSIIQEMTYTHGNDITIDCLVGRITTF